MSAALVIVAGLLAYLGYVLVHLGFPLRLSRLRFARPPLTRILERAAARRGAHILIELETPLAWGAPCHVISGRPSSYWSAADTLDTVSRLAGAFSGLGLSTAERVAIYKANEFDLFLFACGTIRAGGIAAPINTNLDPETAARYIDNLGARVLITDRAGFERLFGQRNPPRTLRHVIVSDASDPPAEMDGVRIVALEPLLHAAPALLHAAPRGDADPLYIFHTSGTTGMPKGVIVTAGGMAQALRSVLLFNLVSRRDLAYFALPLNHQVSHLYLYALHLLGIRAILSREMDPKRALLTLATRRLTVYFGFPITYARMLDAGIERHDLSSMRIWGTTADPSHEAHQRPFIRTGSFFSRLGIPVSGSLFIDGLGSSEVGIAALLRIVTPWTRRFERRVGRPTPGGPSIRVVDDTGETVPVGCPGRLLIKGPCMFGGYWNAHDLLYATTWDGWWFTGDIVLKDASGEYAHLDREVDVIRGKSYRSYTLPIEEVTLKHPAVHDACVFGVTLAQGHEVPAAVVALRRGQDRCCTHQLRTEINGMLPTRDRLRYLWAIEWSEFPIGATGKTLKRVLRERYNQLLLEQRSDQLERAPHSADVSAKDATLRCAV